MQRLVRITCAVTALALGGATVGTLTTAAAATGRTCGTGKSVKASDHMDMDHGTDAMDQNCPVVAGAPVVKVTGDNFAFEPATIDLTAGETVTIALMATDVAHDFYVKGIGHIVHAKAGKTARGSFRIKKAGTYKYWCTILGHKKQGMVGTITVT